MSSVISTNKTYHIMNARATTRRLNLYSSGSASNGMNVVLYTNDTSNEQKWYFDGDRLCPETNRNYCLDRYTASAYLDNADIWKASASDAAAQIVDVVKAGDYCNIRLRTKVNGEYYYLTAVGDADGTGSGKSTTSTGNVYWAPSLGSLSLVQKWVFTEVGGSSSGETGGNEYDNISNQTLSMPIQNMRINVGYKVPIYLTDPATSGYGQHYGADYVDNNLPGGGVTVPDNIIASGEGFVYKSGYDTNAGYFACIVYPKSYIKTSSTGTYQYQDVTVRYWHMAAINSDFNNVDYTSPKQIHKGDVIGTMGKEGVATGIHLHIECDTDTTPQYTFWSPTHWKSPDKLQNGTDSTINPGWVFHKGSNQTVTVRQSDINTGWVLDDDYKYIGNYSIV